MYQNFPLQDLPKYFKIAIFGLKIKHLATPNQIRFIKLEIQSQCGRNRSETKAKKDDFCFRNGFSE
jgi:hypothetical protein